MKVRSVMLIGSTSVMRYSISPVLSVLISNPQGSILFQWGNLLEHEVTLCKWRCCFSLEQYSRCEGVWVGESIALLLGEGSGWARHPSVHWRLWLWIRIHGSERASCHHPIDGPHLPHAHPGPVHETRGSACRTGWNGKDGNDKGPCKGAWIALHCHQLWRRDGLQGQSSRSYIGRDCCLNSSTEFGVWSLLIKTQWGFLLLSSELVLNWGCGFFLWV